MMSELETLLLEVWQEQQKDFKKQLTSLSGQLNFLQSMLSDSLEKREVYIKTQESMLKRILLLEKKLNVTTPPEESQEDEGEGGQVISSEIHAKELMEKITDSVREIICVDGEEARLKGLLSLPSTSDFVVTYDSVMELGWIDIQGRLTEKGEEERERILSKRCQMERSVGISKREVKAHLGSDEDIVLKR